MVSVMSSPGDDDGSGHERNSQIKSISSRNLRRRLNAAVATNGDYRVGSPERKHDGESDANGTGRQSAVGFPKSLTPFVHIQNTDAIEAELEAYENTSRSQSPDIRRQETDEEAQQLQNRTISYDQENVFHASFLTTDCSERSGLADECGLPEYSSRTDGLIVDKQIGNALKDPPSVGSESAKSIQRHYRSYDSDNREDLSIKSGSDSRKTGTDSGSSSSNGGTPDPNTWLAKFQRSRRFVGRLVNNEYVTLIILILIVVNAILIGVSVTKAVREDTTLAKRIDDADFAFLVIFTIEIIMQFYYYGFGLFLDRWLVFDLVVVIISWNATFSTNEENENGGGQVLRSFRIFRGFRLVTRIKPLRDLVLALGEVLPRMSAIVLMLMLVFYVFAVMFTENYKELDMSENYFNTLHDSLLTCFQMMTMEWVEICRELMEDFGMTGSWFFIVIYVMIAGFIVFNLIVAVVVEAVSATEETVRRLDGIESNSPASKLAEAQERIDLLQSHLSVMMDQQEQIQFMLEAMAGELLHLETERMKAKMREENLKAEISRRIEEQKKMEEQNVEEKKPTESFQTISMQFLQKIEAAKAQRKKEEEEAQAQAELSQAASDQESMAGQSAKKARRVRSRSSTKPSMSRDGSGKSFGTDSGDSGISAPDNIDSPNQRSTTARKKSEIASALRSGSLKGEGKDKSTSSKPEESDRKKKAIGNWKKLLAVQKDFDTSS